MRNKILFVAMALLMTCSVASAQESRKLLTIEDVVLNRELSPKGYPVKWVGEIGRASCRERVLIPV